MTHSLTLKFTKDKVEGSQRTKPETRMMRLCHTQNSLRKSSLFVVDKFHNNTLHPVVDCKPGQIMAQFFATRGELTALVS